MEIDLTKIDTMSSSDIENIRVEKIKELSIHQNHTALVEQKIFELQIKIIGLQKEKKEYELSLSKGKQSIRELNAYLKILESKFWTVKNSGQ